MSETLVTIEQAALTRLPAETQMAVRRIVGHPFLKTMGEPALKSECLKIIVKAFNDQGQTVDARKDSDLRMLEHQRNELMREARRQEFSGLTIEEVRWAFDECVRGASGPFYGMCAKSYHQFLKWGKDHDCRVGAVQAYFDTITALEKKEPTIEEKKERSKRALLNLFAEYKATNSLGVCPWAYCGVLADLIGTEVAYAPGKTYRTFITDDVIREKLNDQAEREFEKENVSEPAKTSIYDFEGRAQKKVTAGDAIMRSIVQAGLKKEEALANKKKEVALRWYFDHLITQNKPLEI